MNLALRIPLHRQHSTRYQRRLSLMFNSHIHRASISDERPSTRMRCHLTAIDTH